MPYQKNLLSAISMMGLSLVDYAAIHAMKEDNVIKYYHLMMTLIS
jgi:hypothetical protein